MKIVYPPSKVTPNSGKLTNTVYQAGARPRMVVGSFQAKLVNAGEVAMVVFYSDGNPAPSTIVTSAGIEGAGNPGGTEMDFSFVGIVAPGNYYEVYVLTTGAAVVTMIGNIAEIDIS